MNFIGVASLTERLQRLGAYRLIYKKYAAI